MVANGCIDVNAEPTRVGVLVQRLDPGQQLTFVSDGVVEATSARGELFGFDRTREISAKPAAVIAEAAQTWGQNDDITVLRIEFIGAPSEAPDEVLAVV